MRCSETSNWRTELAPAGCETPTAQACVAAGSRLSSIEPMRGITVGVAVEPATR